MGPIPPVNVGPGSLSGSLPLNSNRSAGSAAIDAGPQGMKTTPPPLTSNMLALTRVHSAVSGLLQSIGGGLEDDKTLRMLIALIILLALLESSQNGVASSRNALASLGAGGVGQSQFISISYSSTTISIQQTITTMVLQSADGYASGFNGEPVESPGGQLDISA